MAIVSDPLRGTPLRPGNSRWQGLLLGLGLSTALHAAAAAAFLGWTRLGESAAVAPIEVAIVTVLPGDRRGDAVAGKTETSSVPEIETHANPHPAEFVRRAEPGDGTAAARQPSATLEPPAIAESKKVAPAHVPDLKPAMVPSVEDVAATTGTPPSADNSAAEESIRIATLTNGGNGESRGTAGIAGLSERDASPIAGNPIPVYPRLARRRGLEGEVLLRVEVGSDGRPLSVTVVESSGHEILDTAARTAVGDWYFLPAERQGVAIASTVKVPVVFRLER